MTRLEKLGENLFYFYFCVLKPFFAFTLVFSRKEYRNWEEFVKENGIIEPVFCSYLFNFKAGWNPFFLKCPMCHSDFVFSPGKDL